uniref:uncharacterized protein LOC120345590 n=1 Tax=Styela clava TaxID=7725 RepID=UPI001939DD3B|nr:uncharacterized protein LOC120345590 [Styela clava]
MVKRQMSETESNLPDFDTNANEESAGSFDVEDEEKHAESHNKIKDADSAGSFDVEDEEKHAESHNKIKDADSAGSFDVEDEEKHAESHNEIKDADSGNQQKIKKTKNWCWRCPS